MSETDCIVSPGELYYNIKTKMSCVILTVQKSNKTLTLATVLEIESSGRAWTRLHAGLRWVWTSPSMMRLA